MRLLFVCTGNVCRSPVAERLVRAWAGPGAPVEVTSAGVTAVVGASMDAKAAAALTRLGGDPSAFRARPLTAALDPAPDLTLTMTRKQRTEVLRQLPRGLCRTFTLLEAADLLALADLRELPRGAGPDRTCELALRLDAARRLRRAGEADDVPDPIGLSTPCTGRSPTRSPSRYGLSSTPCWTCPQAGRSRCPSRDRQRLRSRPDQPSATCSTAWA